MKVPKLPIYRAGTSLAAGTSAHIEGENMAIDVNVLITAATFVVCAGWFSIVVYMEYASTSGENT